MVANAGVSSYGSLLNMSVESWDRTMNVNARGVMLQYKYAAEQLVKQGRGGRIIGKLDSQSSSKMKLSILMFHRSFLSRW